MSKKELFEIFQQCFGRLLTPFEIEDINKWIDEDDMPIEVVNTALKEAVANNKISWKYINKILIDWHKAGDNTLEKVEKRLSDFEARKKKQQQFFDNYRKPRERFSEAEKMALKEPDPDFGF